MAGGAFFSGAKRLCGGLNDKCDREFGFGIFLSVAESVVRMKNCWTLVSGR